MTNLRKNREKSELGRIGNWDIKRVTEATEEYGGIYRDETIVCRSRFCNVLLNYWCCFRTQKCETKKNLCIIIVLIHHRELRSTFMAVWQLWDDLKRAQSSSKTGGGHIILLLLRFTKKKRWSSGRWKARQEWNLFLNSVCWFDQEKKPLEVCGSLFLDVLFCFYSQRNPVWSGRLLLLCSQMFPPPHHRLWHTPLQPPFKIRPTLCVSPNTTKLFTNAKWLLSWPLKAKLCSYGPHRMQTMRLISAGGQCPALSGRTTRQWSGLRDGPDSHVL